MLAKIVAHGRDRGEAFDRLAAALDATVVLGVVTNLRFLRWLVRQPVVRDGEARIDTLDRIWPPDDWADRARLPDEAWQTAAALLAEPPATPAADPWSGAFRLNARPTVRLASDGEQRAVAAEASPDPFPGVRAGDTVHVDVAGRSVGFRLAPPPDVDRAARAAAHAHGGASAELTAPMPGSVIAVHAAVGSVVEAGDPVVTLEAMKMEHVVGAPVGGRVTELSVAAGDQVTRGQALATVEP
jgi:acetyl-CoA/propionyl-CoA carboxylase biotin carboxyl carrier protein